MFSSYAPNKYEINMVVSSDPSNGAANITTDGSRFQVQLQEALQIPREAKEVFATIEDATIWWVVPNIIQGINDTIEIKGFNALNVLTTFTVVITQGLYNLSGLNQAILTELQNQGALITPNPLITMSPDQATGRVLLKFNYANVEVNFGVARNFASIVGFDQINYGPYIAGFTLMAPNNAGFNTVNSFLIHGDIVDNGIRINNTYDQIMANVQINVAPGSQILYTPYNPPRLSAGNLRGVKKTVLNFYLTDEKLRTVNTGGEYWSARIRISYVM